MSVRTRGFTLFEVLGVILVMTILLSVATNFYINLSAQAARASENTREVRRAAAILDRIAGDLEHAVMVRKPTETDPLFHPWIFVADSEYVLDGSDRMKFVVRETPRSSDGPAPYLALVAYTMHRSQEKEGFELRRWSSPGLPLELDREFPTADDPASLRLTDGIAHFAARFRDPHGSGEWNSTWDSSQLLDSSQLPLAVELELALVDGEKNDDDFGDGEPRRHVRRVQIPVRPLDLEILLDPGTASEAGAGGTDDEDLEGLTLADCVDFSRIQAGDAAAAGFSETDLKTLATLAQQQADAPWAPYAPVFGDHPAVDAECL